MSVESEAKVEAILEEIRKSDEGFLNSRAFDGLVKLIRRFNAESAHFVWELLQNAEDARAERIFFTLEKDRLIVKHTDGKIFSPADVWAICGVGVSSKANDANKIGKFGIGFKSVFNYTDTPLIYSKDFRFQIEKFVYPTSLPKPKGEDYGDATVFILPFNNKRKPKEKAYSDIKEKLLGLSTSSLIFLKNIQEITVNIEGEKFTIKRNIHKTVNIADHLLLEEIELKDRIETKRYYRFTLDGLTLEEEGEDGTPEPVENQSVMISYRLDGNGNIRKISSTSDVQNFFVFFPTKIESHLEYLVHAPFSTSSSRETLMVESPANEILYNAIADLVGRSLLYLVRENKVTTAFYDDVLLETESSVLHERIRNCLSRIISLQHKVLPTFEGKYASLDELLILSDSNLSAEEVNSIKAFFSVQEVSHHPESKKKFWDDKYARTKLPAFLHTCSTYDETNDEIQFNKLLKSLTTQCLESKTVTVINTLYEYLVRYWNRLSRSRNYHYYGVKAEDEIVRAVPLIRTAENKHVLANSNGLYIQNLHPDIRKNEESLNIIQKYFGIKNYDEKEDIKVKLLTKYSKANVTVSLDENVDDLCNIADAMRRRVIRYVDIAHCYLISGKNAKTGMIKWCQPHAVFRTQKTGGKTDYAEILLKGIDDFSFLDERYLDYINSGLIAWRDFDSLKVRNSLRVREYDDVSLETEEDHFWLSQTYVYNYIDIIYGFDRYDSQIEQYLRLGYRDCDYKQIKETSEGKQLGKVTLMVSPQDDFRIGAFIPYLNRIIKSIQSSADSLPKSLALYRLLSESGSVIRGRVLWRRKKGDFAESEATLYSELGLYLRDSYWMYDKDGELQTPRNLNMDTVATEYHEISDSLLEDLLQVSSKRPTITIEGDDPESKELQTTLSNFLTQCPGKTSELTKILKDVMEKETNKKSITKSLQDLNRESSDNTDDDDKLRHPSPVSNVDRRTKSLEAELIEKLSQTGDAAPRGKVVYTTIEYGSTSDNADNEKEKAFLLKEYGGICQICSEQIAVSRGQHKYPYYFVARKLMPNKILDSAYQQTNEVDGWNSLSLCPNCAAKIRYAQLNVDTVEEQIENITIKDGVSKTYGIKIILDNKKEVITYTPKHILALKTVLAVLKKLESEK